MFFFFVLTAVLTSIALAGMVYRDWASPVGVYTFVWGGAIAMFLLGLVDYDLVSAAAWRAVLVSYAGFLVGCGIATFSQAPSAGRARPLAVLPIHRLRLKRTLCLLLVLGVLGFLLQLRHLHHTMGLETLWEEPVKARNLHTNIKYWGYLNILNVANAVLAVLYSVLFRKFHWWFALLLATAMVSALVTTDRTRFFYMVVWAFFAALYSTGGLRFTKGKLASLGLVSVGLLAFFLIIGQHFEREYRDRFPHHIHFPDRVAFLADPYIYLTGSLPALSAMLADENPYQLGKASFSPVVTLLEMVDPKIETVQLTGELYHVPMEINTFSYLQQFYQDFGWFGMLLGPFVCGLLASWFYLAMRRRPTFFNLYAAALLAYCCAISFFVNMFTQEATWFFLGVGYLVSRYIRVEQSFPYPEREP